MNKKIIALAGLLFFISYTAPVKAAITVSLTRYPQAPFLYYPYSTAPYYPAYPSYYEPLWYEHHYPYLTPVTPASFLATCATAGILLAACALIHVLIDSQ